MSTTLTPAPSLGSKILSDLEKVLLGTIAAAPAALPVFVHSNTGIAVFNASETLLASILAQFSKSGS